MKVRYGFVSNSSSSSFVLNKAMCTDEQLEAVRDHVNYAEKHFFDFDDDWWEITEKDSEIRGFTWMDNFDMERFMERLGIPGEAVEFDGGGW